MLYHKGRRVAILGDMLELGPHENAMHAETANDPSIPAAAPDPLRWPSHAPIL
jgi:hypothetical protein